jgi:hypothetical protein
MPIIDELPKNTKFKKKAYRPWLDSLLDDPTTTNQEQIFEKNTKKKLDKIPKQEKNKITTKSKKSDITKKEPIKNLGQSEDKPRTNLGQSEDKPRTNLGQTKNKLRTELRTEPRTNLGQSEDKPRTNLGQIKNNIAILNHFSSLVGLQRKTILFLYDSCQFSRSNTTQPLSIDNIAVFLNSTVLTVRKTIQRLEKKKLLIREKFKNGRSGWTQYTLPNLIFQEVFQQENQHKIRANLGQSEDKVRTNLGQSEDKLKTEIRTELRTSAPSSSSYLNMNSTTTTSSLLSQEFEEINFDCLENIGFTKKHLSQIATRSGLSAEAIQDSIDAFAFDLKKNNKAVQFKKRPLDVLMGLLTKGSVYLAPENYETPQQESMRLYLEKKKVAFEKENKLKNEALSISFEQWKADGQNQKTIETVIDEIEDPMLKKIKSVVEERVFRYYEKNIWPNEKKQFFEDL